jgi:hypothetical protein
MLYGCVTDVDCPNALMFCSSGLCKCQAGWTGYSCSIPCPLGYYCPKSNQSLCPWGTFQTGTGMIDPQNCTLCGVGKYQTGNGMIYETNCSQCAPGTFQTGQGIHTQTRCQNCSQCLQGEYQMLLCTRYQDIKGQKCGPGTYWKAGNPKVQNYSVCSKCAAGTFQTGWGMISTLSCLECPVGSFQFLEGMSDRSNCTLCSVGTYQSNIGMSSGMECTLCGEGKFQTGVGMSSDQDCHSCPNRTYHFGRGAANVTSCIEYHVPTSDIALEYNEYERDDGRISAQLSWATPSDTG